MKTFEEELPDLTNDMHICDDEGSGCIIEEFYAHNTKYFRCRLRRESLETIIAAHQAEMDRVVEKVIGKSRDYKKLSPCPVCSSVYQFRCNCADSASALVDMQRARYKAMKKRDA